MTDLEQELHEALRERADGVVASELRYAAGPRARAPRSRIYAPLTAAAAVLAVGAAIAVWTAGGSSDPSRPAVGQAGSTQSVTPSGASRNGTIHGGAVLSGTSWRLVSVETGTHLVAIPLKLLAGVTFDREHQFTANDGVNTYSGQYRATSRGVVVGGLAGTLAGSTGGNASQNAAIAGIAAVHGSVTTDIKSHKLIIGAHGTTLTFEPTLIDPGFNGAGPTSSGSASPTSTGTPPADVPSYISGSEIVAPPTP